MAHSKYTSKLSSESLDMALTLLLEPDSWADELDGLRMLDKLFEESLLSDAQLKRLRAQLKNKVLLYVDQETRPGTDHFWWYQPWERSL
ncbi:hypothetical protein [Pseudoalteromonas luteoviolacea]|uniref:hypothetical protein n=1 Tax=Pseudoalteromonas luteoviolacea TaxID=43657 RepID=UPI001154428D|nr:hypothetical protein [Pseudoalteromonas luteoviolacea]TQF71797.1 hypothetical protein FLM44_12240 [Pseudoalteromonas luteoviolacea]